MPAIEITQAAETIYRAIEQSEMNRWIGGGDPRVSGRENFTSICENVNLQTRDRVFDFGCGLGRTAIPLAQYLTEGQVVGNDIIPQQIQFCREHFADPFPSARFYCTSAVNPFYVPMVDVSSSIETIDEDNFALMFATYFDIAVAFSVFTHLNPEDASNSLTLLRRVLRPGGRAVLTWFLDHPDNPDDCRVRPGTKFHERYPDNPSDFSVHTPSSVFSMTHESGFSLERISFGYWRRGGEGGFRGQHYQDLTVLIKR